MRATLAAIMIVSASLPALAQSSTATSGTMPNGQPKYQPPPAARSGGKGLRTGNGAADAGMIEIKRQK